MKQTILKLDGCSSSRIDQITGLLNRHDIDFSADRYFTELHIDEDGLWGNKKERIGEIAKTFNLTVIEPKPEFQDYGYYD